MNGSCLCVCEHVCVGGRRGQVIWMYFVEVMFLSGMCDLWGYVNCRSCSVFGCPCTILGSCSEWEIFLE